MSNACEHDAFVAWLKQVGEKHRFLSPYKATWGSFQAGAQFARAEARKEALEEAAKVAVGFRCGSCGMDGKPAAAIRALLEKEESDAQA